MICTTFSLMMQCKVKYHIWGSFWYSAKNSKKLSQKTDFLTFFQRFFDHTLKRLMGYTQMFCQMKGLMKIYNRGMFHQDNICGSKVINFQMFLWWCSSHKMGPFGGFLRPFSPKCGLNLLKFGPEVVHHETKTVGEQRFKIKCLSTNGMYPEFSVLVHFWT